jgi:hypothetical protein
MTIGASPTLSRNTPGITGYSTPSHGGFIVATVFPNAFIGHGV